MTAFGQVIPVAGPLLGFAGKITRLGERVVAARQVLSTTTNPIKFGDGVVIVPDATGGTYQSIADFIGGGGTFIASRFAGVAISEVTTTGTFPYSPTTPSSGQFLQGSMAEALERGSVLVPVNVATGIAAEGPVYVRVTSNGGNTIIGGFEAADDGAHTVVLTGVVFRTGVLDANNMAEITLLNRVAA